MNAEELVSLIQQTNNIVSHAIESGEISFETDAEKESFGFQFFLERFAEAIVEECAKECEALDAYLMVKEKRPATGKECADTLRSKEEDEETVE